MQHRYRILLGVRLF